MKTHHVFFFAVVGLAAYMHLSHKDNPTQQAQAAKADVHPYLGQICKATAAMTFGHAYKIVKLDRIDEGIAYVHYLRPSDSSRWAIKCKLESDKVVWASDNPESTGRWRNDPADVVITFSIHDNKLNLKQVHSDGSGESKTYSIN